MRISRRVVLILMVTGLMAGCGTQSLPTTTPHVSPLASPLPSPSPIPPFVVPTPGADKGVVSGTFLVEGQGEPMAGVDLFLGQLLGSTSDSNAPVFGMDLTTAPHAVTDQFGRFVFTDVIPGKYAVILWTPMRSSMAKSGDGQLLQVTVDPQQTVNLGKLMEPLPIQ